MSWPRSLKLHELGRGPVHVKLSPDDAQRATLAKELGLESLPSLTADIVVKPWLDGAAVTGRLHAVVEQICGVSLDPFEQAVDSDIELNAVPAGSPHAMASDGGDLELDPDAPDPPDVIEGDTLDLSAIVVEHLALALDPFPRKPGVTFDYQAPPDEASPFAALKKLKEPKA